ncbi:unnamed protein product, partial [Allacma fusca]
MAALYPEHFFSVSSLLTQERCAWFNLLLVFSAIALNSGNKISLESASKVNLIHWESSERVKT